MGKKAKRILELILEKGLEEAKRIIEAEKIDGINRSRIPQKSVKHPTEPDDSGWENIVREYEKD